MIHEKPVSGEPEGDPPERENPEQVKFCKKIRTTQARTLE